MHKLARATVVLCCTLLYTTVAQNSLVHNRIRMIMAGKTDEVRRELPELLRDFPNDAGVLFLNGILMDDATKALSTYEQITREYPQSEWADDAQWRIVQYYSLQRDTSRAWRELANYKRNYPLSEFLIHAMDIVKVTVGVQAPNGENTRKAQSTPNAGEKVVAPKTVMPSTKANAQTSDDEVMITSNTAQKKLSGATIKSEPTKASTVAPKVEATVPETTTGKKWGLQIGVYSSQQVAEVEAQKYRDARLRVDIVPKKSQDATMYAIVIGNYSSKESAEKSRDLVMAQCNCTPYIITK